VQTKMATPLRGTHTRSSWHERGSVLPRPSSELLRSLEAMTTAYQLALGDAGRSYLGGRGLTPEAVAYYRLGKVDRSHPEHEKYAGWISIPYITRAGVVSLKFRNLRPNAEFKYITEYPTRLYNTLALDRADKTGVLAITEGEFDCEILDFECGIPAVGIPGVDTYHAHPEWRELFRAYDRVLIFKDNDPPNKVTGKRPGDELAKALKRDIDTAREVRLPGDDVTKTYLEYGPDEIRRIAGD
jgi:hypothetical protein